MEWSLGFDRLQGLGQGEAAIAGDPLTPMALIREIEAVAPNAAQRQSFANAGALDSMRCRRDSRWRSRALILYAREGRVTIGIDRLDELRFEVIIVIAPIVRIAGCLLKALCVAVGVTDKGRGGIGSLRLRGTSGQNS
jgi:hypothetical protein